MKRLLLICYYFPPLGGAGVSRPLALAKHLPAFGWRCDVLTVKPVAYRTYEPELLDGLDGRRIYRSGSTDPQRLLYLLGVRRPKMLGADKSKTFTRHFFPDSKVGWVRPATRLGRTLVVNNHYDLILSTSPPISAHMIALQVAKESKIPWVADFRDFWGVEAIETFMHGRMLARGKELLASIAATASELTTVNDSIRQYLGAGTTIRNSVDSELIKRWRESKEKDSFVIGAVGTINSFSPVEPLLQLMAALRKDAPDLFARLTVRYVGDGEAKLLTEQLAQYDLTEIFTYYGIRGRTETIDLLNDSHLLYVAVPAQKDTAISTGRIFTMLASGRPIIAATPKGSEVARLVESSDAGGCRFLPDDMQDALAYVKLAIVSHLRGKFSRPTSLAVRMQYSAEQMVAQFTNVFDRVLTRTR